MRRAFDAGYDPVLALASATGPHDADVPQHKVHRAEQAFIDSVVNGEVAGEYILLLGPKGAAALCTSTSGNAHWDGNLPHRRRQVDAPD